MSGFRFGQELFLLREKGDLRTLPDIGHAGRWIMAEGEKLLNLSSNDYLGLATDTSLRDAFLQEMSERDLLFSSSSSRLLTGNFEIYRELETLLASLFHAESALVFGSGYHMNTGILPAVADNRTLILADKLVHASLIDGIRLSTARCIRYRHQDYAQLENLLDRYGNGHERIIIVTESLFSMDGDVTPLHRLVGLKKRYPDVLLYIDEAHAVGVRGKTGLGVAEEQGCIQDIDFLCGTFGKAIASAGGFVVCKKEIKEYLINKMRTFIFTTALPPVNAAWTKYVLERIPQWESQRHRLSEASARVRAAVENCGYPGWSQSHIIPIVVGKSKETTLLAEKMRRKGFYVLPVRPPTVPEGTSRLRISLTASMSEEELEDLIITIKSL